MINFKNLMAGSILTSLLLVGNAIAMEDNLDHETVRAPSKIGYKELKTIGKKYLAFLDEVGKSDNIVTQERVSQLFDPNCSKIENGTTLFTLSSKMPEQLHNAHNVVGNWNIESLWMAADTEEKICTLQFKWKGEKMSWHTTLVGLCVNDEGKICEIREVYNTWKTKPLDSQEK